MQKSGLTVASSRIEVVRVERPEFTVKMDVGGPLNSYHYHGRFFPRSSLQGKVALNEYNSVQGSPGPPQNRQNH